MRSAAGADATPADDPAASMRDASVGDWRYASADVTYVRTGDSMAIVHSASHGSDSRPMPVQAAAVMAMVMMAVMTKHTRPEAMVELPLETMMMAQGVPAVMGMSEHAGRGPRKGSNREARSHAPAVRGLPGDAADRPARDGGNDFEQVARLRIAMQGARDFADAPGQVRRSLRDCPRDLGQHPLRGRRYRLGHHRQQFAGGHADQRQKMLGSLIFGFSFGGKFAEVLHHGVGIDLFGGVEFFFVLVFVFELTFALELIFAFAEQAAGDVSDGAEPALAFAFILKLALVFLFSLVLQLLFEFGQGFHFVLKLVRHDVSSSKRWGWILRDSTPINTPDAGDARGA
jgi:hypothetical protein